MSPKKASAGGDSRLLRRVASVDRRLSLQVYTLTQPILPRLLLKSLEISGDGFLFFPVLLSFLLTRTHPLLYDLLLGGLLDLLTVGLLKHLFRRPRPLYNPNMSVAFAVDHFSFPSGHSSRVFCIATLFHLHQQYAHFMPFIWGWAILTSLSRILLGRHFVFDVLAGMLLGVLQGLFVFRLFNYHNLVSLFCR